jgi:HAD superfamily hydrolase (TIGR01509 family)
MLSALIFDVDGTLAETETAHCAAYNAAFEQSGIAWHWDRALYSGLLEIAGGMNRLAHYWKKVDPRGAAHPSVAHRITQLHALKTRIYRDMVSAGQLALRPGVLRLMAEARAARVPMAIATTTTPSNVDALLGAHFGSGWRGMFDAVCDASTTPRKKPAPDVYLAALRKLNVKPQDCLAIEDSRNGLLAASAAGIPVLVTPTAYTRWHDFTGAMLVIPELADPDQPLARHIPGAEHRWVDLDALQRWHDGYLFEAA